MSRKKKGPKALRISRSKPRTARVNALDASIKQLAFKLVGEAQTDLTLEAKRNALPKPKPPFFPSRQMAIPLDRPSFIEFPRSLPGDRVDRDPRHRTCQRRVERRAVLMHAGKGGHARRGSTKSKVTCK